MKIFVTGAAGYIGFSVAEAFRRAGHEVWGLVRYEPERLLLARSEIHPVMGDLWKPESYAKAAERSEVLIHCAADWAHDRALADRLTIETMTAASGRAPRPKTVIFTSGTWIYGDTKGRAVTEKDPPAERPAVAAHRPAVEAMLLEAPGVTGVVIRPSNVYGRRGGNTGEWFEAGARGASPVVVGRGDNHWPQVHIDDLAQAYVLAAGKCEPGVFNISADSSRTLLELATAAARAAGYAGPMATTPLDEAVQRMGPAAEGQIADTPVDGQKAGRVLGWKPSREGFIEEIQTYFEAWQSSRPGS